MSGVKFSLLVPCYNAERFIPRLLEQLSQMTPAFDEVIIADDCSTDGTADLVERSGLRMVRLSKNHGPGGARNQLARLARGQWIHFHDVDDEISPFYIDEIVPYASAEVDVVMHYVSFIDEATRIFDMEFRYGSDLTTNPTASLLAQPMPTLCSLIRRDVFLNVGGFDEELRCFEDGDLHFRMALYGACFAGVPRCLATSLRHSEGVSANQKYCFQCRLQFLSRYLTVAPVDLRPVLAGEFEKTAVELIRHGDYENLRYAIRCAKILGKVLPSTTNPALRLLKKMAPAEYVMRLQQVFRHFQSDRLSRRGNRRS